MYIYIITYINHVAMRLVVSAKCPPMAASEISAPPAPRAVKQPSVPVTGDPHEIQWQNGWANLGNP